MNHAMEAVCLIAQSISGLHTVSCYLNQLMLTFYKSEVDKVLLTALCQRKITLNACLFLKDAKT